MIKLMLLLMLLLRLLLRLLLKLLFTWMVVKNFTNPVIIVTSFLSSWRLKGFSVLFLMNPYFVIQSLFRSNESALLLFFLVILDFCFAPSPSVIRHTGLFFTHIIYISLFLSLISQHFFLALEFQATFQKGLFFRARLVK